MDGAFMAHRGDAIVCDDRTGFGVTWDLSGSHDDRWAVLSRIAGETEIVSGGRYTVVADLWGWCAENWRLLERAGSEPYARIDGTDDGIHNAVFFVQKLAVGFAPRKTYQQLAEEWGLTEASS
jgi:hypothetical protein